MGPSFAAKTIGYSSRFLAYGTVTFPDQGCTEQYVVDGFHTIDFRQLYYTPIVETTTTKAGCVPYANPRLSLPAELTNVDPAWKTCQPLFYGAFDPPSVLTKASRLAPAQADPAAVTPTPPPVPALPAVAKATPAAQTPAATTTPNGSPKAGPDPLDVPKHPEPVHKPEVNSQAAADSNGESNSPVIPFATPATVDPPAPSASSGNDPNSSKAAGGKQDSNSQVIPPAPAVIAGAPGHSPVPETDPNSQKAAGGSGDPHGQVAEPAAAVIVKSPVQSRMSAANVVIAQGATLTENGPPASIGGKTALYSSGSIYVDSTPVAVPANAQVSPIKAVVAQGQTLSEDGPSAVIGGKTAVYKAGSVYYDSTPVAVPTLAHDQLNPPPVVAVGVTFAPTVQTPSPVVAPVVAGGITFQPGHVRSPNAAALETPAPLSVDNNPVLKAANGGLIVAGNTIPQGSTTSLRGHVIAANSDNVVVDGTTHSLAPVTAHPVEAPIATPLEIANSPVLKAANGALVIAGSTVSQGSTTSLLGHAISVGSDHVVLDGTTHAFGPIMAHPLETPAPLEIANRPVIKASNGGLVIAGTTIPQGTQTSLFGHVISVGVSNVIDNGKTFTLAANTEAVGHQPVTSLLYGSSNIVTTLTPGATYSSNGHVNTYTGSTPSALTEATSSIIGTTTVPLQQASALSDQIFVEASVSPTPEQLFVEPSASNVEYVLNGNTATAAAPSDVPLGGLILAGLGGNGSALTNSSVLPSIVLVNGTTAASITTSSQVGSLPSFTSQPGSRASPSGPHVGRGPRVMGWWLWVLGNEFVVFGYIVGIAIIAY